MSTVSESNYVFAATVRGMKNATQLILPNGAVLRRATLDETSDISRCIDQRFGFPNSMTSKMAWQRPQALIDIKLYPTSDAPERPIISPQLIFKVFPDPSELNFFVIDGLKADAVQSLHQAFDLSPVELDVALSRTPTSIAWHRLGVFDHHNESDRLSELGNSEISETTEIFEQLARHDNQVVDLKPAIAELGQLKTFPAHSNLRILGYFAVIESLLTHKPDGKDPTDSLTRQMKTKLTLIGNRWNKMLKLENFGEKEPKKIWEAMYEYRSCIAHGNPIAFNEKKLKPLIDQQHVFKLVRSAAKAAIRFYLEDLQLAMDLKSC